MRLADILDGKAVVVCAGAGGVGKTTSAAAIGVGMAQRGRRVLVITIDPARRLASALGMPEIGDAERRVDLEALGIAADGELWATMLDAKRTFDELIAREAPSPEARDRILANRIYVQLSSAVAGSQEYMAVEKLYELHGAGRYDLIILDTPPARNAMDFLDAPARLTRFVEGKALRFLLRPGVRAGRFGLGALGGGPAAAFALVERLTGVTLLSDLGDFLSAFEGMYDGFRDRAAQASALLASPQSTFLVVTVPEEDPIAEAEHVWRALAERDLPFGGVVVNKVHPDPGGGDPAGLRQRAAAALRSAGVEEATARLAAENLEHYQALAARDRGNIERLRGRIGEDPLLEVPFLDHDVHDLQALLALAGYLFATRAGERAAH